MKKFALISNVLLCVFLSSCVSKTSSTTEDVNTTTDTTLTTNTEDATPSSDTSSETPSVDRNWTEEQIELFNQYLDGYILPSLPTSPSLMRYFSGSIVIDYDDNPSYPEQYKDLLTLDGFDVSYHSDYQMYDAKKMIDEYRYIYVAFINDEGFQISAELKAIKKERDRAWTNEEKQIFKDHLQNVILPFPDTGSVSIRYTNYSSDNYVYITGNYSDLILGSYLNELSKMSFALSKHKVYGIDVAKKQLTNNRYIELWVAIADEPGAKFFEVMGRVHQGTQTVIDDKHVVLGTYPQSEVLRGESIYKTLLNLTNDYPTESNKKDWFVFDDHYASYEKQNTGFYKDITVDGDKYRALYFLEPRTVSAMQPVHDDEFYYQVERNGYYKENVYFFKFEPIMWEIMKDDSGVKTLAPTSILDINYFSTVEDPYQLDGKTIYPSNYEHSFIRNWLNNTFYDLAFSSSDKTKIQTTLVDNSEDQCALTDGEDIMEDFTIADDYHDYLSTNTQDNVYLFSRKETLDFDFGYPTALSYGKDIDVDKAGKPASEYAAARGALISDLNKNTDHPRSVNYYLRTPNLPNNFGISVQSTSFEYGLRFSANPCWTNIGVFPGISVKL